jgi:uncharacterized cofD-like protein
MEMVRSRLPSIRIVALGGGTGLPVVLQGLKSVLFPPGSPWVRERDRHRLTAVVTVADDGGSSGRLRRAYHVLPPGDVRNCLLALADGEPSMSAIFSFRFNGRGELRNHNLGNLILTALSQLERDFSKATDRAGRMLAIRGKVLPSTGDDVTLLAELSDGTHITGESRISLTHRPIRRVHLRPEDARALPETLDAIAAANIIVLGPGSLYTSLIPILLVKGIAAAIASSRARVILVVNLMTEPGETDAHSAVDFIRAIRSHAPNLQIHDALLNSARIPAHLLDRYGARGSVPIPMDPEPFRATGCRAIPGDFLEFGPVIRHDPRKLARTLVPLALERSA